jgi:hypothetical protein
MGTMYGSQFEDVSDFLLVSDPGHEDHSDHEHGPGCGHEEIQHGDQVDYLHGGHRHFFKGGK